VARSDRRAFSLFPGISPPPVTSPLARPRMICQRPAEPDQPVPAALLPRKARLGEEFLPKLHIQPERSLGLTARTPQGPAVGPGRGGAPTPPVPAGAQDSTQPPAFAGLAKVGRPVWSKMSASESSIADPGKSARTTRPARLTPPAGRFPPSDSAPPPRPCGRGRREANEVLRDGNGVHRRARNGSKPPR